MTEDTSSSGPFNSHSSGSLAAKGTTLGEFLRHERERRGITIEQVASATKVGVRTLHALEADHFAELPAKPFIRGFVTSYCRFIGLDTKEVLARFEDYIQKKSVERPNREGGHSGYAFERKDGEQQSRTILMIAMFSFIAFGGLAMLFLKPSLRHRHNSHIDKLRASHSMGEGPSQQVAQPISSPIPLPSVQSLLIPEASPKLAQAVLPAGIHTGIHTSIPTPVAVPVPVPIPASTPSTVPSPVPAPNTTESAHALPGSNPKDPLDSGHTLKNDEIRHKVLLKPLADVWVRYQVDDRPVRKFIVRTGKVLVLRAKELIRLQVSNPKAAVFQYNGKPSGVVSESQNFFENQGGTLFFPMKAGEEIETPFPDSRPLPGSPGPPPSSSNAAPSP